MDFERDSDPLDPGMRAQGMPGASEERTAVALSLRALGIVLTATVIGMVWVASGANPTHAESAGKPPAVEALVSPVPESSAGLQDSMGAQDRPQPEATQIRAWIRDLGAERYRDRERATERLLDLGEPALPFLREALEFDDPELQDRAARILREIEDRRDRPREAQRGRARFWDAPREDPFDFHREWIERFMDREPFEFLSPDAFERSLEEMLERLPSVERPFRDLQRFFDERPFESGREGGFEEHHRFHSQLRDEGGKLLEQFLERSRGDETRLGIIVETLHPALRAHLPIPDGSGLLVERVAEDSPAARAGVVRYDIVLAIDGEPIESLRGLRRVVERVFDDARSAKLEILRHGENKTLELKHLR